jgi:malonyl-CoA O-methyltransferase
MEVKHGIRRNFARRAATYDAHAQMQRFMADELLRRIGQVASQARSILEIGCGTGYLTKELRRLNHEARLVAIDLDVALIQEARQKLNGDPLTAWLVADGETLARGRFDLIISNSTFQWFSEPGETLQRYWDRLTPGGCLAFAAMGPKTFQELAASLKRAASELEATRPPDIAARYFLGESQWQGLLMQAGFAEVQITKEVLTLDFPTVRDFLKSLQATGATNPHPRPLFPRLLRTMMETYKAGFGINGTIPATYEVIWALARK